MPLHSTDRFLTTHTGSLPRPDDLIRMMFAREEGVPVDADALGKRVREAIGEMVRKQAEAGVDVINDGEMSKPSYATYVKDRLNGFGGTSNSFVFQDLVGFPKSQERVFGDPGRKTRKTPGCNGPISVRDHKSPKEDVENLNAAAAGSKVTGLFSSAASPGVISLFFRNDHYKSHEDYLYAIAEAMRYEYETIANSGITLQLDCPDLAMGRHVQYADLSLEEFRKRMRLHIEALNHAVRNIPADRLRMHMCWGNYPGPHHCDVPFRDIIDVLDHAKPTAILFEAANPRHAHEWRMFEEIKPPKDKVLIPGVIECQSNYIEHPELVAQRIERYANLAGRENVMAGVDCGFSVHVGQGGVDPDVVWKKLAALAEGARIASKRFWKSKLHQGGNMTKQATLPSRLHHNAYVTRDMEATRKFYEEVIGLPLVATWSESDELFGAVRTYCHCFFGLGDGGALAFFQFEKPADQEQFGPKMPFSPFHHIALNVDAETQKAIEGRIKAAGYKEPESFVLEHGYCRSVYVTDPNGLIVEFTLDAPNAALINQVRRKQAHEDLSKWLKGDHTSNNTYR